MKEIISTGTRDCGRRGANGWLAPRLRNPDLNPILAFKGPKIAPFRAFSRLIQPFRTIFKHFFIRACWSARTFQGCGASQGRLAYGWFYDVN